MKIKITAIIVAFIIILGFTAGVIFSSNFNSKNTNLSSPRLGEKMWVYNMNKYQWRKHNNRDIDNSEKEITLQYQGIESGTGYTSYKLLTGNYQVPKEDVIISEGSQEFLYNKNLYSYFPKTFEFYNVIFNGVKFVPKKLSAQEVKDIFKDYKIIKVSDIQKGNYEIKFSKNKNKYIILNDNDEDFYKYYIVPNDSKKLELGNFSNQFTVLDTVNIKIQRLEGCTKTYPCYEIQVK